MADETKARSLEDEELNAQFKDVVQKYSAELERFHAEKKRRFAANVVLERGITEALVKTFEEWSTAPIDSDREKLSRFRINAYLGYLRHALPAERVTANHPLVCWIMHFDWLKLFGIMDNQALSDIYAALLVVPESFAWKSRQSFIAGPGEKALEIPAVPMSRPKMDWAKADAPSDGTAKSSAPAAALPTPAAAAATVTAAIAAADDATASANDFGVRRRQPRAAGGTQAPA